MGKLDFLKPDRCPFCGSHSTKVVFKSRKFGENGLGDPIVILSASVRCNRCRARGPVASGKHSTVKREEMPSWHHTEYDLKFAAVQAWERWGEYD